MAAAAGSFPALKLLKATYGATPDKRISVVHHLEAKAKEGNGALTIDKKVDFNHWFGTDPEPGTAKKLVIHLQYGDGDVLVDEYPESRAETVVYQAEDKPTDKMFGKLTLTIHRATDLHNTATFGVMDPFYVITCSAEKFTSKVAVKGHQTPNWEEQHMLNLDGSADTVHFQFSAKGVISDSHIGRVDVPLGTLVLTTEPQWITINEMANFNKQAGKVLLSASFKGRGGPRPKKAASAAAAASASAAAPAPTKVVEVVYVPQPVAVLPVKPVEGPALHCDQKHLMMWHEGGDRCAFGCSGCGKTSMGISGAHYQCPTCMTYWLCTPCSQSALEHKWSPPPQVTAPICDKGHACTDFTGRKPVGYHNEYKCDVCGKQHAFGQLVKFYHCDPCQFDCCVPCAEKFINAGPIPPFKTVACAKGHGMHPGWNRPPATASGPTFACCSCNKQHPYKPAHDYYHCDACAQSMCAECVQAKAKSASASAAAAVKK